MNAPVSAHRSHEDVPAIRPEVLARAAAWMARLWSGEASSAEEAECTHWRAESPEHERAWQELQVFDRKLDELPREVAQRVLREPAAPAWQKRDSLRRLLGLGIVLGGASQMLRSTDTWQRSMADYATATGEIREIRLADGTHLVLGTATTLDVRFDEHERRIELTRGEVLITTAHDPARVRRPFRVYGRHGRVEALGTRFSIRQDEASSRVSVFEGLVELRRARSPDLPIRIAAGEATQYTGEVVMPPSGVQESAAAWSNGVLLAENMRVADFIAELSRYRPGLLRCDPAVAELRVSGVFSLRDTDRALQNLARALPVVPVYRSRYWVTLQAA